MQNGWTALIRASFNGHTAIVQYLVKETSALVNTATSYVSHSNNGVFSAETAILFLLYNCIINVSRVHNCFMYMYP